MGLHKQGGNEVCLDSLLSRLHRVERENRWMKVGVFTILSVLVFLGAKGQEIPDEIHAGKIVVSNDLGKVELNPAGLFFYDADKGNSLTSYYGEGSMELKSTDDNHRLIYIGQAESEGEKFPVIRMFSKDGSSMVLLDMNHKGGSSLRFITDSVTRVRLGGIKLEDRKTGSTIVRPSTSLVFFDEKGKVVWSAP